MVKKKKEKKVRYAIRISDVPKDLFDAIVADAKKSDRTNGNEVLQFLKLNYKYPKNEK